MASLITPTGVWVEEEEEEEEEKEEEKGKEEEEEEEEEEGRGGVRRVVSCVCRVANSPMGNSEPSFNPQAITLAVISGLRG